MITQNTSPVYVNRVHQDWMANGGVYGDGGVYYQSASNTPTLNFQFAGATAISSQITFTRASSATYYNAAGLLTSATTNTPRLDYNPATLAAQGLLIEEQRVNLVVYSNNFDNAAWIKTNAAVSANVVASPSGNVDASAVIEDTATNVFHTATGSAIISGVSGAVYTLSIFAKPAGRTKFLLQIDTAGFGNGNCIFDVANGTTGALTGTASAPTITAVGNGWYRCSVLMTATGSFTSVDLKVILLNASNLLQYTGDGTSGLYLYGAQLEAGAFATSYAPSVNTFTSRASTGSYFDATGTLQSAAINVARNTYNPANLAAQPYLLLEEARTNSIRNNTMVGAVAGTPGTLPTNWFYYTALTGLTSSVIGTGTDSGVAYLDVRVSGTPSGVGTFSIGFETNTGVSAVNAQTWAESAYLKLQAGSFVGITETRLQNDERSATTYIRSNNSAPLSIGSAALNTQRFSYSFTLSGGVTVANTVPYVLLALSGVAIDITLRIGLPQLEQGAYATSVIPTTTTALTRAADLSSSAQATRAADVASVNTLSPWYNASEGTLYAETLRTAVPAAATYPATAEFDNGTLNRWGSYATLQVGVTEYRAFATDANVAQADIGGAASRIAINTVVKQAFAAKLNDFALSVNGSSVFTDTVGTLPSTVNRLGIGSSYVAANFFNGYIRRITYYPRSLADAELISLTT